MKISVVGLGFVGTVTAVCLCEMGHEVVGVDIDQGKVDLFAGGHAPILEPQVDQLMADVWLSGRLRGTADLHGAITDTDVTFVCVGTLRNADGSQDISAVESVVLSIGKAVAGKDAFHSVVIRSTVLPGTTRNHLLKLLERATGGSAGESFGFANNPEFLREGSAVDDFKAPSRIVIGEIDKQTGDRLASIYSGIDTRVFRTSAEIAETVKYADNSWHALKVVFANEMDLISGFAGVDGHSVMDIFCEDKRLNISSAYLRPGFAFGGSCLPKDVAILNHWCRTNHLDVPVLAHISASNENVIARMSQKLLQTGIKRIAVLGLAYKAGVCDLRGSPFGALVELLVKAGRTVRAFDPDVWRGRRFKAGQGYTDAALDGLDDLLVEDVDELLEWGEMIVVTSHAGHYSSALSKLTTRHVIVDLTGMRKAL